MSDAIAYSELMERNKRLIDSYEINREAMLAELSRLKSRLDEAEKVIEAAKFVLIYLPADTFEAESLYHTWLMTLGERIDEYDHHAIAKRSEQQEG